MGSLFSRLGFTQKLVALNIVGTIVSCTAIVVSALYFMTTELKQDEIARQEMNIRVALEILNPDDAPFRLVDGKLTVGDRSLEDSFEPVDEIKRALGVTVTLFRGDTRAATALATSGRPSRSLVATLTLRLRSRKRRTVSSKPLTCRMFRRSALPTSRQHSAAAGPAANQPKAIQPMGVILRRAIPRGGAQAPGATTKQAMPMLTSPLQALAASCCDRPDRRAR